EEVARARVEAFDLCVFVGGAGNHQHRNVQRFCARTQLLEEREAVHARRVQIHHDEVRRSLLYALKRNIASGYGLYSKGMNWNRLTEELPDDRIIVNDQAAGISKSGRNWMLEIGDHRVAVVATHMPLHSMYPAKRGHPSCTSVVV